MTEDLRKALETKVLRLDFRAVPEHIDHDALVERLFTVVCAHFPRRPEVSQDERISVGRMTALDGGWTVHFTHEFDWDFAAMYDKTQWNSAEVELDTTLRTVRSVVWRAHCYEGARLLGTNNPVPTDPRAHTARGEPIACNRLACDKCGADVRHFDGYRLEQGRLSTAELAELMKTADASSFAPFESASDASYRFYFCLCFSFSACGETSVEHQQDFPWACAGHPQ
jgi:hypothetical protein